MAQEHWTRAQELFHSALERAPEARRVFLDAACGRDTNLRREVDLLLTNAQQAAGFLDTPAVGYTGATQTLPALPIGHQFGPYMIVAPLGAGGMGEVYRAHDGKLGRDVAIKTLPPAFACDSERLARFRREARTLASLNHPNIAAIYGLEQAGDLDYLVLELVEGENLRGPLPLERALDYACQVAEGLEAAHEQGIIHRDLKPANVKVTPKGRVKILDFGLAKAIWGPDRIPDLSQTATPAAGETLAGHILGTPGYMSPEQTRGQAVDARTDIWAFGCLLYELMTGKRAFRGGSAHDTAAAVLESEPDWQSLPAKTPASIRQLLRRCLQKDADRRLIHIAEARLAIDKAQRRGARWIVAGIAAAALVVLAIAAALWLRNHPRLSDVSQWVQLTKFPDSVSQPALSPDGRMVTFVRGSSTFFGPGQIYAKILPDGQAVQLTRDSIDKMSPVFSADGTRIAYTAVDPAYGWNTWIVPTLGGEPRQWLRNASGLSWAGPQAILFSEFQKPPHLGIVAAQESRIGKHDIYWPMHEHAMAHRSYLSPDGKWVLVVEMDQDHLWVPCRLVPSGGGSMGHQVGPAGAGCTAAAWTPDGKWMYFTSETGGAFHIWRQRFPDGKPEQVTSGPTEEEGIAMAPDGRSFVTAVGVSNVSIWIHTASGERQLSLEGNAAEPKFTRDGSKLCYRIVKEAPVAYQFTKEPGAVWVAEVASGRSEPVIPGFLAFDYDVSADGKQVVIEAEDALGKPQLWLAAFDHQSAPRPIPNVEGRTPRFGPDGEVFFRSAGSVYRVRPDGTGMRKAFEQDVFLLHNISPDGRWITLWARIPGGGLVANQAVPLSGGPPVAISGRGWVNWSPDGRFLSVPGGFNGFIPEGRSYLIPLAPGRVLPQIPAGGFHFEQEVAALPGARRVNETWVMPGPSPDLYAFYRGATQRNLYRIPVP